MRRAAGTVVLASPNNGRLPAERGQGMARTEEFRLSDFADDQRAEELLADYDSERPPAGSRVPPGYWWP